MIREAIVTVVSLVISVPVYLIYRRAQQNQE
jgi:hypothetical protein